jgi:hypothetical protein
LISTISGSEKSKYDRKSRRIIRRQQDRITEAANMFSFFALIFILIFIAISDLRTELKSKAMMREYTAKQEEKKRKLAAEKNKILCPPDMIYEIYDKYVKDWYEGKTLYDGKVRPFLIKCQEIGLKEPILYTMAALAKDELSRLGYKNNSLDVLRTIPTPERSWDIYELADIYNRTGEIIIDGSIKYAGGNAYTGSMFS